MPDYDAEIQLDKDRCVRFKVTDKEGRIYVISAEFLGHEWGDVNDEVSLLVFKLTNNEEHWRTPNRISIGSKTIIKPGSIGTWFEFHEIDEAPQVPNK